MVSTDAQEDGDKGASTAVESQENNPQHGITLETMLKDLVAFFGWKELANRIPIQCFYNDPSIKSSLKFLRRTPWARAQVEALDLMVRTLPKKAK